MEDLIKNPYLKQKKILYPKIVLNYKMTQQMMRKNIINDFFLLNKNLEKNF